MHSRTTYINKMLSYKGMVQGDKRHRKLVDTYNMYYPLPRGVKMTYTSPWCAMTVSTAAIECGYTDIIPVEVSCTKMIELAKAKGIWQESDSYIPSIGDLCVYDWDDNGCGDCTGTPDHIGAVAVVDTNKKMLTIIEGNKGSNHVCDTRDIAINGRYIRGFITPKFDDVNNVNEVCDDKKNDELCFSNGDVIKLKDDATYYNGKAIPKWVMKSKLYYRGSNQNGLIFSILKSGPITGVVNPKYVYK